MQKLIGAIVILVAALGYGGCCIQGQRRHFRQLMQWKEYIWLIQNRMENWNIMVIPLLEEVGYSAQEPFSAFFLTLASSLKTFDSCDVLFQWRRIAEEMHKEFEWSTGEWETFLDGGKLFALSDKELINKEASQLSNRVEYFIGQAQADQKKKEKLYVYLSASVGIMLILLFI